MSSTAQSKSTTDQNAPQDDPQGRTDVTVTRDSTSHDATTITDGEVRVDNSSRTDTKVSGEWPQEADRHVRGLINQAIIAREQRENVRANHRNFNRMLTLFGALVISFVLTWLLYYDHSLPMWAHKLAPFSFAITILMDSSFTVYALIRHY